ncbi:MAG: ribosome hibernation-promoting factor, HPF/YfiA family [Chitinophagales bacterium]
MKVQIQAKQFSAGQHLIDFIEKKLTKLEQFFDRIIDTEVFLSLEGGDSSVRDKVVKIKVNLPGNQIIASERSKLFEEAVDLSVSSLSRQLKRHKEKLRQ